MRSLTHQHALDLLQQVLAQDAPEGGWTVEELRRRSGIGSARRGDEGAVCDVGLRDPDEVVARLVRKLIVEAHLEVIPGTTDRYRRLLNRGRPR